VPEQPAVSAWNMNLCGLERAHGFRCAGEANCQRWGLRRPRLPEVHRGSSGASVSRSLTGSCPLYDESRDWETAIRGPAIGDVEEEIDERGHHVFRALSESISLPKALPILANFENRGIMTHCNPCACWRSAMHWVATHRHSRRQGGVGCGRSPR